MTPEQIQLLKAIKSMKSFEIDNSFEIAFHKQLLIPYFNMDDMALAFPEFSGSAIYMVLQSDRLELIEIDKGSDPPGILYRNCTTGRSDRLDNLWFFPFPIPRNALHMEIVSNAVLEVGIKKEWRSRCPQFREYIPIKISIYDLITQSGRETETVSAYELLYIGSSKNIYRRLNNHETILKIFRHNAASNPTKELFVWILKPKPKFYNKEVGAFAGMLLSSSVWQKEGPLSIDVEEENLLLIAEAMLINYFKPEYNEQYVSKMPSSAHVVFTKLKNAGAHNLQVNLNLFMQTYKVILTLKTSTVDTDNAKHLSLLCTLESLEKNPQSTIISAEVMPEILYPFLIGD